MTSTEEKITLEQMPQLLVELKGEILGIKEMIAALGGGENSTADQRMDLDAFRAYHPDKPARPTIYEWVGKKAIPVHKDGKKLRFLRSEIDEWLNGGRAKTQAELDREALEYVQSHKHPRK